MDRGARQAMVHGVGCSAQAAEGRVGGMAPWLTTWEDMLQGWHRSLASPSPVQSPPLTLHS